MKCPKCKKGELKEELKIETSKISLLRRFNFDAVNNTPAKKIYTYFCPLCDFHKEKVIETTLGNLNRETFEKQNNAKAEANIHIGEIDIKAKKEK